MATATTKRISDAQTGLAAWLPLATLPIFVLLIGYQWPSWIWMWALALAVYAGLKWLTLAETTVASNASWPRRLAYLLLWPGMDAATFLREHAVVAKPIPAEWLWAVSKLVGGLVLLIISVQFHHVLPLFAAWTAMVGIVFALHFGLFHILSLAWRRAGFEANPIMDAPIASVSLGDFWGRRWNRAFRDLSHAFVYRPLAPIVGVVGATLAVFLMSGLVHDLVISVPARGGWGLPTAYFLIQALGIFVERSKAGKWLGLRRGLRGRLFAAVVIVAPLPLLFHQPFCERVILPMLSALRSVL